MPARLTVDSREDSAARSLSGGAPCTPPICETGEWIIHVPMVLWRRWSSCNLRVGVYADMPTGISRCNRATEFPWIKRGYADRAGYRVVTTPTQKFATSLSEPPFYANCRRRLCRIGMLRSMRRLSDRGWVALAVPVDQLKAIVIVIRASCVSLTVSSYYAPLR